MMEKHETALGILDRPGEERQYFKMPTRYDGSTDEVVPVTQEWVNLVESRYAALGRARYEARRCLMVVDDQNILRCHPQLQAFLDAFDMSKPEQK